MNKISKKTLFTMEDQELMDIIINYPKLIMVQPLHMLNLPANTENGLLGTDHGFTIFLKEVLTLK